MPNRFSLPDLGFKIKLKSNSKTTKGGKRKKNKTKRRRKCN